MGSGINRLKSVWYYLGMANNYGISEQLEKEVRKMYKHCVYCGRKMKPYLHTKGTPGDKATFEHIDNDGPPTKNNIVMCCGSCNSSKGVNKLSDWLNTSYCIKHGISAEKLDPIIRRYIKKRMFNYVDFG